MELNNNYAIMVTIDWYRIACAAYSVTPNSLTKIV